MANAKAKMPPSLLILTGASGAGKTTLARRIAAQSDASCKVCYFDSIGVPSTESMVAEYGSGELWQRAMTLRWLESIRPELALTPVLLEGQMRIAFILEALMLSGCTSGSAKIVLVDCDDVTRTERLHIDRLQPELATADMMSWAAYLRAEALQFKIEIIDTGATSIDECVEYLTHQFRDLPHVDSL